MSAIVLRSTRVLFPDGDLRPADLLIEGDTIDEIHDHGSLAAAEVRDVGDLVVMPGVIDIHVHCNEPGRTDWEGFETATAAAVAGGTTTIIDMPLNSEPTTITLDAWHMKLEAAEGILAANCGFHAGVVQGNVDDLDDLLAAGAMAGKAFMIKTGLPTFSHVELDDLRKAMPILAEYDRPLLVHAELSVDGFFSGDPQDFQNYLIGHHDEMELRAIRHLIELCREIPECRVHIVHLSSAKALPMLREARAEGLKITVETCPHYLLFAAEDVPYGATEYKCGPPIRSAANQALLREAVAAGEIDLIASDHSPCTPELKNGDFLIAWGGISSLQFLLPATWTVLSENEALTDAERWQHLHRLLIEQPSKLVDLPDRAGLEEGNAADLIVFDPDATFEIEESMIHHRHKLTPYLGRTLRGVVKETWVNGHLSYNEGGHSADKFGLLLVQ